MKRQVRLFKPDIILVLRGSLPPYAIKQLRKISQAQIGLWEVDDPYNFRNHIKKLPPYHFMITQDSSCVSYYRRLKKTCLHLPLAVNPNLYHPFKVPKEYQYDICFIGSALPIRLKYFDELTPFLLKKNFIIIGQWWEQLKNYNKLKPHIINRTIPPSEVAKYYNGAKIVLNIHRTPNDINQNHLNIPAYTPNNRTFDIAACRAFQLISRRRDLKKFYELDEEIISFKRLRDLKQKIEYYLDHDEERNRIASQAYERTMKDHTYSVRLRYLIHLLEKRILGKKGANR
ncbi:CgeB family protein [Desmospora profundinema]|uniref:Spore maturation protein CgeB n=1 Tax=Desmospora profundinema TaxID=1571184 RepID=A0ABU1IKJ7_9BACL|nr:glycosyltransferase [Desmospora profundinema]MDR6225278.1 spore maturation protein CgeB [Desmospora profundinema]